MSASIVYFDQRLHACPCFCLVEYNEKHSKIIEKVYFSSCPQEAHIRLMLKKEEQRLLVSHCSVFQKLVDTQTLFRMCVLVLFWQFWSVLNCFPSCEQACVRWLKYTTSNRQSTIIIINILILKNGQHQLNENRYFLSRVLYKHWVPKGP